MFSVVFMCCISRGLHAKYYLPNGFRGEIVKRFKKKKKKLSTFACQKFPLKWLGTLSYKDLFYEPMLYAHFVHYSMLGTMLSEPWYV